MRTVLGAIYWLEMFLLFLDTILSVMHFFFTFTKIEFIGLFLVN